MLCFLQICQIYGRQLNEIAINSLQIYKCLSFQRTSSISGKSKHNFLNSEDNPVEFNVIPRPSSCEQKYIFNSAEIGPLSYCRPDVRYEIPLNLTRVIGFRSDWGHQYAARARGWRGIRPLAYATKITISTRMQRNFLDGCIEYKLAQIYMYISNNGTSCWRVAFLFLWCQQGRILARVLGERMNVSRFTLLLTQLQ